MNSAPLCVFVVAAAVLLVLLFPLAVFTSRATLSSIRLFFTLPPRSLHQRETAEASGRFGVRLWSHTTADDISDFGSPSQKARVGSARVCVCVSG